MTHKQTDTASKIAHFCDSHGALTDPNEEVLIFCYQGEGGPTDQLDVKIELSWFQCTQFFSYDMKTCNCIFCGVS